MGEVEVLEAGEAAEGRREVSGEVVAVEEDAVEGGGIGESRRDGSVEAVSMEVESAEEDEGAQFRREVGSHVFSGDVDGYDSGVGEAGNVHTGDAGPGAGGGIVLVPVSERRRHRRRIYGGLECEEGEPVRRKRQRFKVEEDEDDYEDGEEMKWDFIAIFPH